MSTELKMPTPTMTATRFAAGNGVSHIQLTTPSPSNAGFFSSLQLSRGEALMVAQTLLAFGLGKEEEA